MKTNLPALLAFLPLSITGLASAQSWIGTNGNWSTASSWAGGALPSINSGEVRVLNGNIELTTAGETNSFWLGGTGPGQRGVATLTIKDGGSLSSGASYIGPNAGSPPGTGTLNVEGTGSWTIRSLGQTYIGIGGLGVVNVTSGGTVTSYGPTYVGYNVGATTGALRISGAGSSWTIASGGSMTVGLQNGGGVLTLEDGGTLKSTLSYSVLGLGGANSNGTINIGSGGAAGNLQVNLVGSGSASGTSGTINFNHNETGYVFNPIIQGNISIEQKGTGTTSLTAANTYTGTTTVTSGELKANNSTGSAFGTSNVTVNASTTLSGTGSFTGSATIDGTYAPGNSVGNLTSGGITIGATGEYEWEINKADGTAGQASGGWDLATINGTLTFQEGATLSIVSLGLDNLTGLATAFDDSQNYLWTIASTTGGISGLENVTLDTTGFQNTHTGTFSLTTSGNSLQLSYTVGTIPEPASALLTAIAMLIPAARRRRR